MTYNNGIQFTKDMFNNFPFPELTEKDKIWFINIADLQIDNYTKLQEKTTKFYDLLRGDFKNINTLPLVEWYNLDWRDFLSILKKQKISITGTLKDDWHDRLMRLSADARSVVDAIAETERVVDERVCGLYGVGSWCGTASGSGK